MRTSCLVNNYNYRRFLGEAIDSALAQHVPFDEVIVVDDGSTDGSVAWLNERYAADSRVVIVTKPNGGQLSAFCEGLQASTGDLLFFLDADDIYFPKYTQEALAAYEQGGGDFIVAGMDDFGPNAEGQRRRWFDSPRQLGYSVIRTLLTSGFYGGPTSALSMRREIAERILAYPHHHEWRTRADSVLTIGASLVGAKKHQLGGRQVGYRHHGDNLFSGQAKNHETAYRYDLVVNRMAHWFAQREAYDLSQLVRSLHREFETIEQPTRKELCEYLMHSLRARLPLKLRARQMFRMVWRYANARQPSASITPITSAPATPATRRAA